MTSTKTASIEDVLSWLEEGVFVIEDGKVFKGDKELTVRIAKRKRMNEGDPRVDLFHNKQMRSTLVSHLIWMSRTMKPVPEGFQIHHKDEDPTNNDFDNLVCVHPLDHIKLHKQEEVPF